jgi:hypothetical protein
LSLYQTQGLSGTRALPERIVSGSCFITSSPTPQPRRQGIVSAFFLTPCLQIIARYSVLWKEEKGKEINSSSGLRVPSYELLTPGTRSEDKGLRLKVSPSLTSGQAQRLRRTRRGFADLWVMTESVGQCRRDMLLLVN